MGLTIRPGGGEDLYSLMRLGKMFCEASPFAKYCDERQMRTSIYRMLSMETTCCFVAETTDEVVGLIMGIVVPLWFNQDALCASELAWFVDPAHRGTAGIRLLEAFEEWADEQGAVIVSLSQLHSVTPALHKLLGRRGYELTESTYAKVE